MKSESEGKINFSKIDYAVNELNNESKFKSAFCNGAIINGPRFALIFCKSYGKIWDLKSVSSLVWN